MTCDPAPSTSTNTGATMPETVLHPLGALAADGQDGAMHADAAKPRAEVPPQPAHGDTKEHPRAADGGCAETASMVSATPLATPAIDADDLRCLAPPEQEGELGRLSGYRILRILGHGGMGIVFEAYDPTLDRRVAIKVVRPGDVDASIDKRFLQEARLAASLSSDRVVTIHQVGEHAGALFIVMELLSGETLAACLAREHTLPVPEALRLTREVAEGLAAAHNKKLIHRDIKPANIWLRASQHGDHRAHVKILDFGIAKPLVPTGALNAAQGVSVLGQVLGTPCYMSPEQACGEAVDERSDLFSLGCLLHAMLVGKSPFERANPYLALMAVTSDKPYSIADSAPHLPAPVVKLANQLLQKSRDLRPASARAVADSIKRLEAEAAQHIVTSKSVVETSPHAAMVRSQRQKIGLSVWIGGMMVLAAGLFGAWGAWHQFRHGGPANPHARMPAALASSPSNIPPMAGGEAPLGPGTKEPLMAEDSAAAEPPAVLRDDLPPIKVGILHSLTGPMAATEKPIVDGYLLAIEELNNNGGLLNGRRIEPVVRDGQSNERVFADEAEKLITEEHVVALFGCWRSTCRKTVEVVCNRHKHLLIYPATYEGLEQSPYVVYMGGAPNQQILPAVKWAFAFLQKRRYFLVGVDGIYSRSVSMLVKDEASQLGATVVGEEYLRLGAMNYAEVAEKAKAADADLILSSVIGPGVTGLFESLHEAGITPDVMPVLSVRFTEQELQLMSLPSEELAGNFAANSYFQSLPSDANQDFVKRFRERFGAARVVSDPIEAAYAGTYAWASAVFDANSDRVADIRRTMVNETLEAPEGQVIIGPDHHAIRSAVIGQITSELDFDVIWASPKPIRAEPFPGSRTREQWKTFEQDLFHKWGGNWRPADDDGAHDGGATDSSPNNDGAADSSKVPVAP